MDSGNEEIIRAFMHIIALAHTLNDLKLAGFTDEDIEAAKRYGAARELAEEWIGG